MKNIYYLAGAYGKVYTNETEARTDWIAGRDFRIANNEMMANFTYCSCRDMGVITDNGDHLFFVLLPKV